MLRARVNFISALNEYCRFKKVGPTVVALCNYYIVMKTVVNLRILVKLWSANAIPSTLTMLRARVNFISASNEHCRFKKVGPTVIALCNYYIVMKTVVNLWILVKLWSANAIPSNRVDILILSHYCRSFCRSFSSHYSILSHEKKMLLWIIFCKFCYTWS
jgi:hypothetical protein